MEIVLGQISFKTFNTPEDLIDAKERDGLKEKPIFLASGICARTKIRAPKTTP